MSDWLFAYLHSRAYGQTLIVLTIVALAFAGFGVLQAPSRKGNVAIYIGLVVLTVAVGLALLGFYGG
jgi:hypothetical protein